MCITSLITCTDDLNPEIMADVLVIPKLVLRRILSLLGGNLINAEAVN